MAAILTVFAGAAPLESVDDHLHADVLVHIDSLQFRGREAWKTWARHSHATWDFAELNFETVASQYDPEADHLDVDVVAHADGRRSPPSRIRYGFRGDKVGEIWTSRRNYGFLYGPGFTTWPGFVAHLGAIGWWQRVKQGRG